VPSSPPAALHPASSQLCHRSQAAASHQAPEAYKLHMLMSGTMQAALVLEGSSCKGQEGQRVPCAASARRRPGLPACHLHLHLPADCTSPMLLHHPSTKGTCQGPCRHPACRLEAGLSTHAAMPCSATCAAGPAWQLAGPKDQWHLMLQCCLPTCIQGPPSWAGQGRHTGGLCHRLPACL
jgi:hypothetical protein